MSQKKCCVPGCSNSLKTGGTLHKFPNPIKNMELFKTWLYSIGGDILQYENKHIFCYRRVCHAHFKEKYWCRNNRLSNEAVPTENMPGLSPSKFLSGERRVLRSIQPSDASDAKDSDTSCGSERQHPAVTPPPDTPPAQPPLLPPEHPQLAREEDSEPGPAPTETGDDLALDDVILNLHGEAPKTETVLGKNVHKEIAARWQELLRNGLSQEVKDNICQEYLVPANCELLVAPVLNPETKAALTDFIVKRDTSLRQKQQQLGIALAALSQAAEFLILKETPEKVFKPLSDACRLLCDSHYLETKTRRNFVISAVKPELKDTLVNTTRNQFLFGENLNEQIKSAKNIQKTGEGLKVTTKQTIFNKNKFIKNKNQQKNILNYKSSYQKGRDRTQQKNQRSTRSHPQPQQSQPHTRESSSPRRSCRK